MPVPLSDSELEAHPPESRPESVTRTVPDHTTPTVSRPAQVSLQASESDRRPIPCPMVALSESWHDRDGTRRTGSGPPPARVRLGVRADSGARARLACIRGPSSAPARLAQRRRELDAEIHPGNRGEHHCEQPIMIPVRGLRTRARSRSHSSIRFRDLP